MATLLLEEALMLTKSRSRTPSHVTVVAYLALFVALGGGAYAATALVRADGVINACASKKTGALRAVAARKRCSRSEIAIGWNKKGPRGVRGAQGVQGGQGAQGVQGGQGAQGNPGSNATIDGVSAGGDLSGTYPSPTVAAPEAFHEVNAQGEPGFAGTWTNAASQSETVGFYKDREGVVHLRGGATGGVRGAAMFFLPPGYRPRSGTVLNFAAACTCTAKDSANDTVPLPTGQVNVFGGSDMQPSFKGEVSFSTHGTGVVYLDGITFRAGS